MQHIIDPRDYKEKIKAMPDYYEDIVIDTSPSYPSGFSMKERKVKRANRLKIQLEDAVAHGISCVSLSHIELMALITNSYVDYDA